MKYIVIVEQKRGPQGGITAEAQAVLDEIAAVLERQRNLAASAFGLPHGAAPTAVYDPDANVLAFGIPEGAQGIPGAVGPVGPQGPEGDVSWLADLAKQAIADSSNVLALLSTDGAWTLDFMGGLMPRADASETAAWALDGDGALVPAASPGETFFWAINETGGLAPKTGGIN